MLIHRMLLITTGGTIAGRVAAYKNDNINVPTTTEFSEIIRPTMYSIKNTWDVEVIINTIELSDVDSSDILPNHWIDLASLIKKEYDNYDSFIITHGTNTLGYTCAALSFALANLNKPVILTGSQVHYGQPGTDALTNLSNAVRVAVWPREPYLSQIRGVLCVFGSHIITGTRVKKDTEFDFDAFRSFKAGDIGRIGRIININEDNLNKHNSYLSSHTYALAKKAEDLICENNFDMNIVSITEFPGMNPDIFKSLVDRLNTKGFILRAFGAGDASTNLNSSFQFLKNREIPIVVTTQAPNGISNFQVNEPGQYLSRNMLAIPAYDMSIESQTTKLAWLLAKKHSGEITYSQLCKEMTHDIKGEINVVWEIGL
ncbi:MAG: asparaginase [Ignavibacteria bacterium]